MRILRTEERDIETRRWVRGSSPMEDRHLLGSSSRGIENRKACISALIMITLALPLIPAVAAENSMGEVVGSAPSPEPVDFVVSDLKIKPAEVEVGEEVAISFVLSNVGEADGTYNATLTARGEYVTLEGIRRVEVAAGESKVVSYNKKIHTPGN